MAREQPRKVIEKTGGKMRGPRIHYSGAAAGSPISIVAPSKSDLFSVLAERSNYVPAARDFFEQRISVSLFSSTVGTGGFQMSLREHMFKRFE